MRLDRRPLLSFDWERTQTWFRDLDQSDEPTLCAKEEEGGGRDRQWTRSLKTMKSGPPWVAVKKGSSSGYCRGRGRGRGRQFLWSG